MYLFQWRFSLLPKHKSETFTFPYKDWNDDHLLAKLSCRNCCRTYLVIDRWEACVWLTQMVVTRHLVAVWESVLISRERFLEPVCLLRNFGACQETKVRLSIFKALNWEGPLRTACQIIFQNLCPKEHLGSNYSGELFLSGSGAKLGSHRRKLCLHQLWYKTR